MSAVESEIQTGNQLPEAMDVAGPLVVAHDHPLASLFNPALYEQFRKVASHFSKSNMVPKQFRDNPVDIFVALHMAYRLGADPLVIMQNMQVVHGQPGFKAAFMIAQANRSNVFARRIRFDTEVLSDTPIAIKREVSEWVDSPSGRRKLTKVIDAKVPDIAVTASVLLADDPDGKPVRRRVSMREAIEAGWTNNPKYSEMGEQMLSYRASTFLIRLYAQDTMLLPPVDELEDIAAARAAAGEVDITPKADATKAIGAAGIMDQLAGVVPIRAAAQPEPVEILNVEPEPAAAEAEAAPAPAQASLLDGAEAEGEAKSRLEAFLTDVKNAPDSAELDAIEQDAIAQLTGNALKAVKAAVKNRRADMTKGEQS